MAEVATALAILGAVGAGSQIAEQLLEASRRIFELCRHIDDDRLLVRKDLELLKQLTGIAKLIIQNAGLQKDSIASVLGNCLHEIEDLRNLLERSATCEKSRPRAKARKALVAMFNERQVTQMMQRLEREKTILSLCIQEVDS